MLEVVKALGFIAVGIGLSEIYNRRIWKGYREGKRDQGAYQPRHEYHRAGTPR